MNELNAMITESAVQDNSLSCLYEFLEKESSYEKLLEVDKMKFAGYVLELGFDSAKIITNDKFKQIVGGIPRGSFLVMVSQGLLKDGNLPHFTLLRVKDVSPTPLSNQVQETYFELHKKSMPELDVWTQGELQWGALACDVLGMFYPDPENNNNSVFSGDVNNIVSAHRYKVYSPDNRLLKIIVNGLVRKTEQIEIGNLRTLECTLLSNYSNQDEQIPVKISIDDFKGFRTAMFGKTRLGKSNVVKLLAQAVIDATKDNNSVGQLIFDINGEYANDNAQNKSLPSINKNHCIVYALNKREGTESKSLSLNFYEQPDNTMRVLSSFLEEDNQTSNYIKSFASVELPSIDQIRSMEHGDKIRAIRKIQIFWAVLKKSGFAVREDRLKSLGLYAGTTRDFNPGFNNEIRNKIHGQHHVSPPSTLDELVDELEKSLKYQRDKGGELKSSSGKNLFDSDDMSLLNFLSPKMGSGVSILNPYRKFHNPVAGDFVEEIKEELDRGKTVILDLGNANEKIRKYFSDLLSKAIFNHQEQKFVKNSLGDHYIQLYFEEAHNLFPPDKNDVTDIYSRFAKEGAKFHIGMIYSTQSPSTINKELLIQTENFFVGHLSSRDETKVLGKLQVLFEGIEEDILKSRTPGYMRMLTRSHRFVIPVQTYQFGISK